MLTQDRSKSHGMTTVFKDCTEVRFATFFSGGCITAIVGNPLERRLAKCTSVDCTEVRFARFLYGLCESESKRELCYYKNYFTQFCLLAYMAASRRR